MLENSFPASMPTVSTNFPINEPLDQRYKDLGIELPAIQHARAALEKSNDNHLAVLTLAWSYILSALWGESQGGIAEFSPTVPKDPDTPCNVHIVYIPGRNSEAVRWWKHVLGSTPGWQVTLQYRETQYQSPWAIRGPTGKDVHFRVLSQAKPQAGKPAATPPDAATALRYLSEYCSFHGLTRQGEIALSAALVLPTHLFMNLAPINLPAPVHAVDILTIQNDNACLHFDEDQSLLRFLTQIPHLMTISAFGMENLLFGGIFYEPKITTQTFGQWASAPKTMWPESQAHAAAIGCLRNPALSRWYIGAGVTSLLQSRFLVHNCWHLLSNPHLAIWTGSAKLGPHSFLCRAFTPEGFKIRMISESRTRLILREDEVLAAFLCSASGPKRSLETLPPVLVPPPGYSVLDKTSLKIIEIAEAGVSLRLEFANFAWDTEDGLKYSKNLHCPVTELPRAEKGLVSEWQPPAINDRMKLVLDDVECESQDTTRRIMDHLVAYRGEEADEERGDIDLKELFSVYENE
ncbi:hypothetical protein FPQ18DRAFT_389616 [Pyronema domesticum]|nr:hypothetical protein FPQ18DRAFT_389616 [Pyronema domesticum]